MAETDDVHVQEMGRYRQRAELWFGVMAVVLLGVLIASIRVSNGWASMTEVWVWAALVVIAILFLPFWAWHMDPYHGDEDLS